MRAQLQPFVSLSLYVHQAYWGRGAQEGHLDFHTAPELWSFSVALRPQKPSGLLGTGSPGGPPRLSHSSWALKFQSRFTSTETIRLIGDGKPRRATSTFSQVLSSDSSRFLFSWYSTSIETIRSIRDGQMGERYYIPIATLSPPEWLLHWDGQRCEHFNVSLIVRDKVTRQCPQTPTFLKRKESRSGIIPFCLPA